MPQIGLLSRPRDIEYLMSRSLNCNLDQRIFCDTLLHPAQMRGMTGANRNQMRVKKGAARREQQRQIAQQIERFVSREFR